MTNNSNYIQNKLESLEIKIDKIEVKLDKLLKKFEILDELEPQCRKMSDHIDFVENVYDKVKSPMYYILDKITQIKNITNRNIENTETIDTRKLLEQ